MKKTIVFLNIVALITGLSIVFSCVHVSASDYPISSFAAYWRYTVDGVNFTTVNVTPSVTRTGLSFAFPDYSFVQYAQLYLTSYSGTPSTDVNIRSISNISGYAFASNNIASQQFNIIARSQYYNGSQWVDDGIASFSSSDFFYLSPSSGQSARLFFQISGKNVSVFSGQGFEISFSELVINDSSVEQNAFVQAELSAIHSDLSSVLSNQQQINGKLDQTNDLLDEGLNFTAPASDISDGVNDLGGSLIPDLESGVSDVSSAVSDHMPDINAWLSENPTLVSDMMSFSRLANAVMINFVHADGSIFIYISLACFISLLVVIEVNLKRGGGATVHNVYMSRTTPNDRKEDRYSRRGWGDSHRYFTRDRSYGGRYRR